MSREERLNGSVRASGTSRSPRSSPRLYGPGSLRRRHQQLQRSGSSVAVKKPPEPLRRAVAECLSSSGFSSHGSSGSSAAGLYSEAGRTLRDYLAAPGTTDIAYTVLMEHTLAERDRSPAVVSRCVAFLKRYLIRYVPKVQTLQQIDVFCANFIVECISLASGGTSIQPSCLSPRSGVTTAFTNAASSSLPASHYASSSLLKSLKYCRSLVLKYLLPFQPVAFSGAPGTPRQLLPSLSSLLSRPLNSQLSPEPVSIQDGTDIKEVSTLSASNLICVKRVGTENNKYVPNDLFKWKWDGDKEQQILSTTGESAGMTWPPNVRTNGFLEVGAAALLVGDVESKLKDQLQRRSDATDLSDTNQLLQLSTAASSVSVKNHLKAITALKRVKPAPHQVWSNASVSTFHPRALTLFQYRHYSEQQPLRLNPAEVCDVIAAVSSDSSRPKSNSMTTLKYSNPGGKPATDVAVSVLIKLVIDMYLMDSGTSAPLTLFMLEDMLRSSIVSVKLRVFDIILNLGVHAHLLEPMFTENISNIEEKSSREMNLDQEASSRNVESSALQTVPSAIENFESWLLVILYEILLILVQGLARRSTFMWEVSNTQIELTDNFGNEDREEIVWASALSCLLYFISDGGKIRRKRLEGLDIRVIKMLLDMSREHSWSEIVHRKLISILAIMCYRVSETTGGYVSTVFVVEQVDLLGGIDFICMEYARANLREEKHDLFLVLLDYVLDQINESSLTTAGFKYSLDEIRPLATMLARADAPEAYYIAIKHGVEGIGEVLRRSISIALSRSANFEHLNLLLEKITMKLDSTISAFTRLDSEFLYMSQISKSCRSLNSINGGIIENASMEIKLSWSTLHSLLHSEWSSYRHNGYIWLVELLFCGIGEEGDAGIYSNIQNLQQQILQAGSQDSDCSSLPISVSLFCGLLNSKHSFIRWGYLFVLEKLLIRCKLKLDENNLQQTNTREAVGYEQRVICLKKANALIDLMSSAFLLMYQKNEADHLNILKMCDILFSQISLRILPTNEVPQGDIEGLDNIFGYNGSSDADLHASPRKDNIPNNWHPESINSLADPDLFPYVYGSASLVALLLQGYAIVPMQLVTRIPTSLLYSPLLQLASAAMDDIALGVAVGSKARGNLPGGCSDIRAVLLLLLNSKCTVDPSALSEVGGKEFFRGLLDDTDSRVAYYSSVFLLKRMVTEEPEIYQRLLQNLIFKAQQSNNEKLLENPYLQMRGILQLLSDLGAPL